MFELPFSSKPAIEAAISAPAYREQPLRLLSYNIQTGIAMSKYRHYFTHSWKHVLPCPERLDNLDRIARLLTDFDIVGLQEVDAGSLRSGFINQTQYLGLQGRFSYWHAQTNRRLGKFARHSIGLLSRFRPVDVMEHKLPGIIPGRGGLLARFGDDDEPLLVGVLHLAIGRRARRYQLAYIADVISGCPHIILMGDMNCRSDSEEMNWFLRRTGLREPVRELPTYPSWNPRRNIDHILASTSIQVLTTQVLHYPFSDHLPICMEVSLPAVVRLTPLAPPLVQAPVYTHAA